MVKSRTLGAALALTLTAAALLGPARAGMDEGTKWVE